jgi:hypothetical protein
MPPTFLRFIEKCHKAIAQAVMRSAMDIVQVITTTGGILLAGSGILMVCNNPGPKDYERYATESLVVYLKL